jgi:hypothetical protein
MTNEMNHTPGPWRSEPGDSIVCILAGNTAIAVTSTKAYYERYDATDLANANLIAAAPELLDTLERFVTACHAYLPETTDQAFCGLYASARAAIARAAYVKARDAAPTSDLIKASPALLAAARLTLDYLETLPYQPSSHPSTKAQDALHDAIVAAQGVPT